MPRTAVIVDAVRTASGKGKRGGQFAEVHPAELLAATLRALCDRNQLDPATVEDVIAGCVGQVGDQSTNIARTSLLCADFPESVPGTTVDRQCGSSQQAAHFAAQGIIAGTYDVAIACGVESMSRVRMGSAAEGGDPLGPLKRRYPGGLVHQGIGAELLASRHGLSRAELDDYSAGSHARVSAAVARGEFDRELVTVGAGATEMDETVRSGTSSDALAQLRPVFEEAGFVDRFPEIDWRITAGNSSPLTDGASAVLIMSEAYAERIGARPRARFHTMAVAGSDPIVVLDGVLPATELALRKSGLSLTEIDTYEVNEAFAPVPLAWANHFGADRDKLNPLGGAIALGHPLGASGTRILATMLNHLEATGGKFGLMTMCEGGGMANATIIERL